MEIDHGIISFADTRRDAVIYKHKFMHILLVNYLGKLVQGKSMVS